jgi:hypothetical protein
MVTTQRIPADTKLNTGTSAIVNKMFVVFQNVTNRIAKMEKQGGEE